MTSPESGFPDVEYKSRLQRAQNLMAGHDLAALLLTTEPEVRYFTGYLTRFWESPARPWFLIVPAVGDPIAVIPSIGHALMSRTWITDIRTWRSPDPDDDGISLLADALNDVSQGARIGIPDGAETHLRMPQAAWGNLQLTLGMERICGDFGILRDLRLIKSSAEVAKIRQACSIANRAFARVPEIAGNGVPLDLVFREFQMLCLQEGADWVPYLAGAAQQDGYDDVISPATGKPLAAGDVLMLDTGLVRDGYFCDFDRNFAIGPPSAAVRDGHARLVEASAAAFEMTRPGATASDLFHVMDRLVTGGAGGSDAGRLGHGLGMQLTEWPSLIPQDETVLQAGMVLTLEPGIEIGPGRFLVHEENIVVTQDGAEYLSAPIGPEIPVLS